MGARSIVFPNRGTSRSRDYAELTRDVTIRLDWRYTWNRLEGHFSERYTPLNPTGSLGRSQKPLNPYSGHRRGRSNGNCTKPLFKWLSASTMEYPGLFQLITFTVYLLLTFNRKRLENSANHPRIMYLDDNWLLDCSYFHGIAKRFGLLNSREICFKKIFWTTWDSIFVTN